MGRRLDTDGIKDLLYASVDSSQWDDVASRCLSCTNCTMVCPTCFCTSVEDVTDLTGSTDDRHRVGLLLQRGLSSYIHGGTRSPPGRGTAVDDAQARVVARPVRLVRLRGLRALRHVVPWPSTSRPRQRPCAAPPARTCRSTTPARGHRRSAEPLDAHSPRRASDAMQTIDSTFPEHPFFAGLGEDVIALVAGQCGQHPLPSRGAPVPRGRAGRHLLRHPARRISSRSARPPVRPSWWTARMPTTWSGGPGSAALPVAVRRPGHRGDERHRLRRGVPAWQCEADPAIGYALLQRVVRVMSDRLQSARVRLLDLYGVRA